MAGNFGEELLSEPTYLREELWRTFVSYSDLKDGDEGVEELFRSWIDPESVNVALGVDTTSGYWKLESTSPELVKLFKDTAAFRVVGRVRGPRRAFEGPCVAVVELAFRGTDRVANWATNANTFLVPTAIGGCHGKVHQGFQTAYLSLRDAILHNIDTELGKKGIQNGQSVLVRITGHSLGGALATLCAYDFACSRKTWEARCITWGCPRVGNGEFARACLEVVPKCGRYINKMDLPSCLPVNPKDPHDYSNPVRSMLSGASSPLFKALKVSDCEHVCPCVVLDPDTSSTLHVMIAGMEMAVLAKDGFIEGMANHIFGPHYISEYAETLRLALGSAKHRFEGTWSKLPSVGTWLLLPAEMPVYEAETSPKRDASPTQTGFFSSVSSESQEFLKYGWSLLTAFRGRGPRVLIDLHDDVGRYSKQQLAAMGVQPDRFEKVPLETVLKSSPQLLHTEEGCALLRRAQEQLLTLLPMLTVAADEESQPTPSKQILAQMQKNGAAAKLLSWSRKNLKAAESDPEMLRNVLASLKMPKLTEILLTNTGGLRKAKEQCLQILYSEATREHLRAAGITLDERGGVKLQQVLQRGQELAKTEDGREVLRTAQAQALSLLAALDAQDSGTGLNGQAKSFLQELEQSEQGNALIAWGRKTLQEAHENPESLQSLISSLDFTNTSEWMLQCRELLTTGAGGLGLVFEDGVLKLDGLIAKGHEYIESDKGTEFLRNAQRKALHLTKAAVFEQASGYIEQLEKSETSKNSRMLLEQGRSLLASAEEDPDALKKWLASIEASQANEWQEWGAKVVANNEGKRDEFMRTVSEQCSAFLTEQLRIIKVPKIESPADGSSYEYCIDNIDLSSCSVSKDGFFIYLKPPGSSEAAETPEPSPSAQSPSQSQQSSPASSPPSPSSASSPTKIEGRQQASKSTGEILRVTAKDIKVHIPELKWKYAQKTFPYFNGHGTAETVAHGARIMMAFELHSAKVNGDLVPRLALARSQVVIEKLVLSFKESSFSWLYNTMGYLFQESVRDYVVSSLDSALKANIASLLTPLNRYLHPYWPVVLSNVAIPLEKLPSTGVEEYTVVLGQMKEPVGADFIDAKDGLTLIAIEEAGALHRWNETAAAERKVEAFDLLYEVDGKVGEELIQALDNGPLNELMFRRASAKAASEEPDAGHDGKV